MGGSYTKGETECEICSKVLKMGDKVVIVNEATYDDFEEIMSFEPYMESVYHKVLRKRNDVLGVVG